MNDVSPIKKVLLIDDNTKDLFVTEKVIKLALPEVKVITSNSGDEALKLVTSENPNVILLDIFMPGMDGYEACKILKNNPETEDIPVILISSIEYNRKNRLKLLETGANSLLTKPIEEQELVLQLRAMFKINDRNRKKKDEQKRLEDLVEEKDRELRAQLKLRLHTEKKLHESEQKFKNISQLASDYAYSYKLNDDGSFKLEWHFGAFKKITGFSPLKTIKNKNYQKLIHPDELDKVEERNKKLGFGKTVTSEIRIKTKSGRVKWIRKKSKPEFDQHGKLIRIVSSAHDISKQKNAEQAIKEHDESLNKILENIPYAVFTHDLDGNILLVNKMASRYTGYTRNELLQMNVKDIDKESISRKDRELIWQEFQPGKQKRILSHHFRKDGTKYPVEVMITGIHYHDAPIILAIAQDITERVEAEQALIKSEKELKELNAAKDKFFSIIAHDLKSPFGSVLGISELLNQKIDNKDFEQLSIMSRLLLKAATQSYDLLNNLLVWSRAQSGKIKFKPEQIRLCNLIEGIVALFSITAEEKGVKFEIKCAKNIEACADPNMLNAVFRNLISNALKYSFEGGMITLLVEESEKEIHIVVKDEGVGIKENLVSKLFKLEEDISTPGTKGEGGTGLGLKLCKEFVGIHGGKIWVESKWKKGSEFHFTLPVKS